jgi:hypothetical protein
MGDNHTGVVPCSETIWNVVLPILLLINPELRIRGRIFSLRMRKNMPRSGLKNTAALPLNII